jgi:hypothetical protein
VNVGSSVVAHPGLAWLAIAAFRRITIRDIPADF